MSRLEMLEQLTLLVEAIKQYQYYRADGIRRYNKWAKEGLDISFTKHSVEIQGMVINRLEERYDKMLTKLVLLHDKKNTLIIRLNK